MSTDGIEYCQVQETGLRVGYISRGSGPAVIFLHGFPDTFRSFLPILDATAAAGYRAIAPAPRGYAYSDVAPDGDYRIETSAKDVLGFADAIGVDRFSIVGHDWGAVTAYATANLAPERLSRLITAGVPHTGHFLLNLGPRQAVRSSYMVRFQIPWLPEHLLRRDDFAAIEGLIRAWSPAWNFTEADLRPLKENFSDAKRLKAALSYYRQLPRSLSSALSRRLIFAPVATPTRMIYGRKDGCIGPDMFQGQDHRFTRGLDLVPMIGAGHFMNRERPDAFAKLVIDFLKAA